MAGIIKKEYSGIIPSSSTVTDYHQFQVTVHIAVSCQVAGYITVVSGSGTHSICFRKRARHIVVVLGRGAHCSFFQVAGHISVVSVRGTHSSCFRYWTKTKLTKSNTLQFQLIIYTS